MVKPFRGTNNLFGKVKDVLVPNASPMCACMCIIYKCVHTLSPSSSYSPNPGSFSSFSSPRDLLLWTTTSGLPLSCFWLCSASGRHRQSRRQKSVGVFIPLTAIPAALLGFHWWLVSSELLMGSWLLWLQLTLLLSLALQTRLPSCCQPPAASSCPHLSK